MQDIFFSTPIIVYYKKNPTQPAYSNYKEDKNK